MLSRPKLGSPEPVIKVLKFLVISWQPSENTFLESFIQDFVFKHFDRARDKLLVNPLQVCLNLYKYADELWKIFCSCAVHRLWRTRFCGLNSVHKYTAPRDHTPRKQLAHVSNLNLPINPNLELRLSRPHMLLPEIMQFPRWLSGAFMQHGSYICIMLPNTL